MIVFVDDFMYFLFLCIIAGIQNNIGDVKRRESPFELI
jgi:hypothetical protein